MKNSSVKAADPAASWRPAWGYHIQNYAPLPAKTENLTQHMTFTNNLSGEQIRVCLSNRHGAAPLSMAGLQLWVRGQSYPLTVNGQTKVCLLPGEERRTDPLPLELAPGERLELRLTFPGTQMLCGCCGFNSEKTALVRFTKKGRVVPAGAFSQAVSRGFSSIVCFGVRWVEIYTRREAVTLAVFGDSIVQQGHWYGSLLQELNRRFPQWALYNEGISGNRVLRDNHSASDLNPIFGAAGVRRFEEDVFSVWQPDIVLIAEGINDLVHPGNGCPSFELPTAGQLIEGLDTLRKKARAAGSLPVTATLSPFRGYDQIWDPKREAIRQTVNSWIRAQEYVLDIDQCLRSAIDSTLLNPLYDSGDHLHPNALSGDCIASQIVSLLDHLERRRSVI